MQLEGELLTPDATCSGDGATTYATTLTCAGPGVARCGRIEGLRPGAWVHRVRVQVSGSDVQAQSQRSLVLAAPAVLANTVSWTVYPRTFVLRLATGEALEAALDPAAAYTAATPAAVALVTFDPAAFPGPPDRRLVPLRFTPHSPTGDVCADDDMCTDGRPTSYCFSGSRIVVDALDGRAEPGAVVVSVGKCARSVLRITGSDNVLRGLELHGSEKTSPEIALDTIAVGSAATQRNRVERCIVRGPTKGDAVSIEHDAGGPAPADAIVIADSDISGASDKGLKVTTGGHVTIQDSCIHDNRDGGIQST